MDLASLYDEWAERLLGYALAMVRDRHVAEDVVQNVFVKIATSRPDLHDPAAYLFRAVRNEALRAAQRRRGPERSLADAGAIEARPGEEPPCDPATLVAAIDRLEPDQAHVVLLHGLEGLAFREVGEVLGVSQNTAASRWRYALEKLRSWLAS